MFEPKQPLLPVMDARFNLREMVKQMILLEDHLFQARKNCPDCVFKHMMAIEALAEEAVTLDDDQTYRIEDTHLGEEYAEFVRVQHQRILDGDPLYLIAMSFRKARKQLQKLVNRFPVAKMRTAAQIVGMAQRVAALFLETEWEQEVTGDGSRVGIFIPLPKHIAERMPSLAPDDTSPPHVTLLYVGEVPFERTDEFVGLVTRVFRENLSEPVRAVFAEVDHFVQPDRDQRVAYQGVRFSHDMALVRARLVQALEEAEFEVADSHPLVYCPHATLAYYDTLDPSVRWENGVVASGEEWAFDSVHIWGLPTLQAITFT